jgi:two-component system chemotaxis response regulator CheB
MLSGMGRDGSLEIKQLKDMGAMTIAQDEASSVVFGMAYEAIKLDGITSTLSPEGITEMLINLQKDKR